MEKEEFEYEKELEEQGKSELLHKQDATGLSDEDKKLYQERLSIIERFKKCKIHLYEVAIICLETHIMRLEPSEDEDKKKSLNNLLSEFRKMFLHYSESWQLLKEEMQ